MNSFKKKEKFFFKENVLYIKRMIIEPEKYEIHDNGGRPFIVKVFSNNQVQIFENNFISDVEDSDEDSHWFS